MMPRLMTLTAAAALSLLFAIPVRASEPDQIQALSTVFDQPESLQGWQEHQVPGFSSKWQEPRIENGMLVLEPTSSGWFEDMQAGHLYQPIEGNFIVTTRIRVEGTQAQLPQTLFSLAGLFLRVPQPELTAETWQPGQENWMFFALGSAYPAGTPQFEIKSTYNSLSTLKIKDASQVYDDSTAWVDLRIARQGELFSLLYRIEEASEFTLLDQFIRPDLPETLNVGLTAYADWGSVASIYPDFEQYNTMSAPQNGDLIARIQRIDFRRPTIDRFPVATLDPAVSSMPEIAQQRYDDLIRN